MKLGTKVILLEDFTDDQGFKFIKGQTGVIALGKEVMDDHWAVEFDGYDEMKAKEKIARKMIGECANTVPWIGIIPESILEIQLTES